MLYSPVILATTLFWTVLSMLLFSKKIGIPQFTAQNTFFYVLFTLFLFHVLVNLIGALGPELAFDALWYHLTLPKIYLINHAIIHIPGGLFYYSDMPKIAEMFYTVALSIHSEIIAKLIHFSFGLLSCFALYRVARKFFTPLISLFCVIIFYSSLVVGFESITAYIDLVRTFFEIMSFWAWFDWYKTKQTKFLYLAGLFIGFAITTKLLSFGSLGILLVLTLFFSSSQPKYLIKIVPLFLLSALVVPLPWFIFSYLHTGNPLYPFFTQTYPVSHSLSLFNPLKFLQDIWQIFTHADDPISPVYLGLLPLIIVSYRKMPPNIRILVWYTILAILVWYITPRTGGGRFLLPYLPIISLLGGWCVTYFEKTPYAKLLTSFIVMTFVISLFYRGTANAKFIPMLFGTETKTQFLTNHLNFSFGDFYDTDGYFATRLGTHYPVLLVGFHNIYYVDFPFIDSSWITKTNTIHGIAVQHAQLPPQYKEWKKVYQNPKSGVIFYIKM